MTQPDPVDVSVVIPCFDHGQYLPEAIRSVEAARDIRWELIVVDDGSTDLLTLDVMDGLQRGGYHVVRQPNQGVSAARNAGIAQARGRYVLSLDADNRLRPDYMRLGAAILDEAPAVGVVYGDMEYFGDGSGRNTLPDFSLQRILLDNIVDACALFRRALWEECGGWDPQIPDRLGYEDWEFWLQAAKRGWQFVHLNEVMLDYRVRKDSMLQVCSLPENRRRVVRYLVAKHRDLYSAYLPELMAAKDFAASSVARDATQLRVQLAEIRSELDRAQTELADERRRLAAAQAERSELAQIRSELDRAQTELADERRRLAAAQAEWDDARESLDLARAAVERRAGDLARRCMELQETIVAMRTSAFWRARQTYVRLRRLAQPHWS